MKSFWQIFRLIFVIFSLYLVGDAFYRWDGFRYYGSFSEFLPSAGLAFILWSIVAVCAAVVIWLSCKAAEWLSRQLRLKVRVEHVLIFIGLVLCLSVFVQYGKVFKIPQLTRVLGWNVKSLAAIPVIAFFISWLFRNKAEAWLRAVQERITPLVWMFVLLVLLAVPLVTYHSWWKEPGHVVSQEITETKGSDSNRPNILLVTFDTLTARNMSVYGYERETTPFITEWAKSASLFTRVKSESHITTPTTASLMTGKRLWTHQTYHIAGSSKPVKSYTENLPLVLKRNGYYNMAFVVNPLASVRKLGIEGAFDVAPIETGFNRKASLLGEVDALLYEWFGNTIRLYNWVLQRDFIFFKIINKISKKISKTSAPPDKAFNNFFSAVDNNSPEPFFAWIHLMPPHDPYLPPEPFMGAFDSSLQFRTDKSQEEAFKIAERAHFSYDRDRFPPELKPSIDTLRARYDEFILYCDKQFETFIAKLEQRGVLSNTIIILSADHGESFEHNYTKHSFNNMYEQVTHIPLIIKEPGQVERRVIDVLAEQIDISSTILDLADIPLSSWIEGRSLVPLMRGNRLPPRPAFSMGLEGQASRGHEITNGRIAVWKGDYKLIHELENNKSMLFNLSADPGELNNLFDREPERGQNLLNLIQENLEKANEKIGRRE
jgi:arylsulfatase A-like enzyme